MVAVYCTSFVLLIISIVIIWGFHSKLKYGFFHSVILGLLLSIPTLYMFILDFLNFIGRHLYRVAAILGGEEIEDIQKRIIVNLVSESRGVSEVQVDISKDSPQEDESTSETEGDK